MRRISDAKLARGGIRNLAFHAERFDNVSRQNNVQTIGLKTFSRVANGSNSISPSDHRPRWALLRGRELKVQKELPMKRVAHHFET
jgi:hypothetical protein